MIEASTSTFASISSECVEEGRIKLDYVPTAKQVVDLLTKALGRVRFQELCDRIDVKHSG
jgi:hypothetical protein